MADSLRNLFPLHQKRPKGNPKTIGFLAAFFPPFLSLRKEMGLPEGQEKKAFCRQQKKSVSKKRGVGHVPPKAKKAAGHSPAAFTSPQPGKTP